MHVEVGHYLRFFASVVRTSHPWKLVVVLGWLDEHHCVLKVYCFDGKRYLGESILEGALCEMYEKCLIKMCLPEVCKGVAYIFGGWLGKENELKKRDGGLCYCMLHGANPKEDVNGCFSIEIYSES